MVFGIKSGRQRAEVARGKWWDRMSEMVQAHTGRAMLDSTRRFAGSTNSAEQRSTICDAMTDAYAGDFRHVGLVRGLARQLAVRDVDNMIAASPVPRADRAILDQRTTGEPMPADVNDRLRQAAAEGFTEALGDHLRTTDVARNLMANTRGAGPQMSPMRTAATALFRSSREAQAQIPPEQHENAITSIQQAMENHARMIDGAAQDLYGHSGLPPRALEQTLLETRMLGSEIAGTGIEAVDRLAHPPAPTGVPVQAAAVDVRAAQNAASSGVAPAGSAGGPGSSGQPGGVSADPRLAHRMDAPGASRHGAREV
ncbi:MAG TPA: hypothetical protein VG497_27410 [Kribbella sp.]|nr:hypothetical protein [Kribbella sp.]